MKYLPIIGLEVHVELKTKSKMFCGCGTEYFGKQPNTYVCPVCIGLPGALPVPNRTAIEWCVKIALALNCKINEFSKFDRKNYFYPDLPKGYQISQYELPFGYEGWIDIINKKGETDKPRRVRIRRVHMEEDTGKLMHEGSNSFVDFNRSSVPLVEIVTEPDFRDAADVIFYLKKLHQIVQYLGVSNADLEKGDMRMEPNISLQEEGKKDLPAYKVEIKNINSFNFVLRAISKERSRQESILKNGKTPIQETRGWNEKKDDTFSQRLKEEAQDYRYFPEPDIPPIRFNKTQIETLKSQMPELPDAKIERFQKEYSLSYYDSEILCRDRGVADYFEEAAKLKQKGITPKDLANAMINKKIEVSSISPAALVKTVLQAKQTISINDDELNKIIQKIIAENTKAVEDYKKGKQASLMFLLGQVMRAIGKKVDTNIIKEKLQKQLT